MISSSIHSIIACHPTYLMHFVCSTKDGGHFNMSSGSHVLCKLFHCFAALCVSMHISPLVAFFGLCCLAFPQGYPHSILVLSRHFLTNASICMPKCIYQPLNMDTHYTFIKSFCLPLSGCFAVILWFCFDALMPNIYVFWFTSFVCATVPLYLLRSLTVLELP